jgi:hypothetical protein
MLESSSHQRYVKALPVRQAGIFCQRTADAVHPLIIDQVIGDGEIDFFQDFDLAATKKEIFEQNKKRLKNHLLSLRGRSDRSILQQSRRKGGV